MGVKHWVRAMLVLSALPATVAALGLGEIRLKSPLNAPLDAEIELVNASPEELSSLKAQLASRETFARYGLEWPAFLGSVTLTRDKSATGSDVLRVRSAEAITEPFVTLLVDANWGRGRLVREYTLLLDPPTFAPSPTPPVPVAAAVTPSAAAVPAARREPAPVQPRADEAPDSVAVRRGDTLSGLAARALPDRSEVSLEQAMVGLYRSNPRAFGATMNDLRAGAVLRVPDIEEMTAISRDVALAEVARQGSEWRMRGQGAAASEGAGRLRLVPPEEPAPAAVGDAGSGAEMKALQDRLGALEQELNESRRLLELRSAQVAELQARLTAAAAQPPAAAQAPAAAPVAQPPAAAEQPVAPPGAAEPSPPPAVAEAPPAPVARPIPRPVQPPAAVDEVPAPSLLDTVLAALGQFWWAIAGLVAVIAGLLGFRSWQRKRELAAAEESAVVLPPPPDLDAAVDIGDEPVATAETTSLRRPNIAAPAEPAGFVVEESGEYARPAAVTAVAAAAPVATVLAADETLSGDTNLNLDQGDPLAEADFHMAYGLYDQAADLVKLAITREPQRRDLRLKLAEVFFVWGNRDEFLRTARELHETRSAGGPGEWEKIVIMGRQIAPEEPLFDTAMGRMGGPEADLDLSLDAGTQELDIDLAGEGTAATQLLDTAVGSELLGASDNPTEIFETPASGRGGVVLEFNDRDTSEGPILDIDLSDELSEAQTVEQPALSAGVGAETDAATIREKLDAALRLGEGATDQTAELAIDDLGLELGELDPLDSLADEAGDVVGDLRPDLESTAQFAALAERVPPEPERERGSALGPDVSEFIDIGEDGSRIAELAHGESPGPEVDLGFDDLLASVEADDRPAAPVEEVEAVQTLETLDAVEASAGSSAADAGTGFDLSSGDFVVDDSQELSLNAVEPATISEVGTKLDLARAYIDMGDPDGARSILQEVLQEGSVSQKQEAQRLVEALPG
jgi:pilus assembly protein FimV